MVLGYRRLVVSCVKYSFFCFLTYVIIDDSMIYSIKYTYVYFLNYTIKHPYDIRCKKQNHLERD